MAIISKVPDFNVSILVDGRVAQEYPRPGQEEETQSDIASHVYYIESKSGHPFFVRLTIAPERKVSPENALILSVDIDGEHVGAYVISNELGLPGPHIVDFNSKVVRSPNSGGFIRQFFAFSAVSTVEETAAASIERDTKIAKNLGAIRARIYHCRAGEGTPLHAPVLQRRPEFVLAEKALKGKELSHGTSYDQEEVVKKQACRKSYNNRLFAEYTFRYRSRAALQKEMIIPQTPPPPEQTFTSELGSMSDEDIRLLAAKMLRIKQDKDLKREPPSTPSKRTIDLTDDDAIEVTGSHRLKVIKLEDGTDIVDLTE